MGEKTIALVTRANKGIGYEIAAGLGALGWSVGVGTRDEQRRTEAVAKLRAAGADAFAVPLDVTCDESVAAAAKLVEEWAGRLDVLVNNAGVPGGWPEEPTSIDLETVRRLVETNVIGVIRVTNAMLPLPGNCFYKDRGQPEFKGLATVAEPFNPHSNIHVGTAAGCARACRCAPRLPGRNGELQ
jgi:NAD(P)-dependent dehydrogenase (short-subunit alcohol dehydrogenase family)